MVKLKGQMLELRHLRNAAKGLLRDDVAFLKGERGGQKVGPRLADKASGSLRDAASGAADFAGQHKLKIGTGVVLGLGAFAAWIFRDRIEQAFDQVLDYMREDDADDDIAQRTLADPRTTKAIGVEHD